MYASKKRRIIQLASLLSCVLFLHADRSGSLADNTPAPLVESEKLSDIWKFGKIIENADPDEISISFFVRFDSLPSTPLLTPFCESSADGDGRVLIRLFARPEEFLGDWVMRSTDCVKKGEWHHVEFNFSHLKRRASLYLDGKFQWENDNLNLPKLRFFAPTTKSNVKFSGAARDFRYYDYAVPSEELAIESASRVKEIAARVLEETQEALRSKNGNLRDWTLNLRKAADEYVANAKFATIAAGRRLLRESGKIKKLAAKAADSSLASLMDGRGAIYTVPPIGQEIFLPYDLPVSGDITGRMRIVAARGEYESGSAIVVAFAPLTIKSVTVSDLRTADGKIIKSDEVDVKIVKRWFRSGLSWLSYHSDRRQRNLTPDLLVNDENVIKVDELRKRNYLRLDYPEGVIWADVSDPAKGHISWNRDVPLHDATTLQSAEISEAGRNLQYFFTFHVPQNAVEGIYKGTITFDGVGSLQVELRVLPFDLPKLPSPYEFSERLFVAHMNSFSPEQAAGASREERIEWARDVIKYLAAHNMHHTTGLFDSPLLAALSREAGISDDRIFGLKNLQTPFWGKFYPNVNQADLTLAEKNAGIRASLRYVASARDAAAKYLSADSPLYSLYFSEASSFAAVGFLQAENATAAHLANQKVFAHGWSANMSWAADIQDMHVSTSLDRAEADRWHAVGAEILNYAYPFPSAENPEQFRRMVGMKLYKEARFDGHMLHGFLAQRIPWNEFASDPGGDGNYRNFCMAYPTQGRPLFKLAMEGMREAYDDLRYATRLKQIAYANADADDFALRREARRALAWLDGLDGDKCDLDMMRLGIINRIISLITMCETRSGVIPPTDIAGTLRTRR